MTFNPKPNENYCCENTINKTHCIWRIKEVGIGNNDCLVDVYLMHGVNEFMPTVRMWQFTGKLPSDCRVFKLADDFMVNQKAQLAFKLKYK